MLEIRNVERKDKKCWFSFDQHITEEEFYHKVNNQTGYIIQRDREPIGVLRYNMLWDSVPFITLIYLKESERKQGIGKEVMLFWENEMKRKGFPFVMTSTQMNEKAQYFYRKLSYRDCGCLVLDAPEPEPPIKMFLIKKI